MLPNFLAGSYKRYKADTNVFTAWLSRSAAACGYTAPKTTRQQPAPSSNLPTPPPKAPHPTLTLAEKLRAQAEKKAKKKEDKKNLVAPEPTPIEVPIITHTTSPRELQRQAEIVARNAKVKIPDAILKVTQRAIQARRRLHAWFQETGVDNGHSDEGHMHFIEKLEEIINILVPDSSNKSKEVKTEKPVPPKPKTRSKKHDFSGLNNRFSNLDVEDTEDIADASNTFQSLSSTTIVTQSEQKKTPDTPVEVYELEYDDTYDRIFEVFCFFEDLHRLQDFLNETWRQYKRGEIDLLTASLTTNAAFDIIRREEEEVARHLFPSSSDENLSYRNFAACIFFTESLPLRLETSIKANDESLRITPFDNFIYLSTARTLMKYEPFARHKILYPPPVYPARASYLFDQDLLKLPEIQKMEDEDTFLTQMLMELAFESMTTRGLAAQAKGITGPGAASYLQNMKLSEVPVMDELSRGFWKLREDSEISTWLVFASRILLDIREILGDGIGDSWGELKHVAHTSKENLRFEHTPQGPIQRGERWVEKDRAIIEKVYASSQLIEKNINQTMKDAWMEKSGKGNMSQSYYHTPAEFDAVHPEHIEARKELQRRNGAEDSTPEFEAMLKSFNMQPIPPAKAKDFIYASNPLWCGFKEFEILLDVEQAGTSLASHHQSIFAVAHLYNAALQTNVLNTRWPEMDYLISKHENLYFGTSRPTSERDFASRYAIQLGVSAKHFARNKKGFRSMAAELEKRASRPGYSNGPQMPNSKTSTIFRGYFEKKKSLANCLHELEQLIQKTNNPVPKSTSKAVARNHQYQRQLTPLQLLTHIQNWLPEAMQEMRIDYISLVRTCNVLLKKIRQKITDETRHEYLDQSGGESLDRGLVIMVLSIFNESRDFWEIQDDLGKKIEELSGQLDIAGEVMEVFVVKLVEDERRKEGLEDRKKGEDKTLRNENGNDTMLEEKNAKVDISQLSMIERLRLRV